MLAILTPVFYNQLTGSLLIRLRTGEQALGERRESMAAEVLVQTVGDTVRSTAVRIILNQLAEAVKSMICSRNAMELARAREEARIATEKLLAEKRMMAKAELARYGISQIIQTQQMVDSLVSDEESRKIYAPLLQKLCKLIMEELDVLDSRMGGR